MVRVSGEGELTTKGYIRDIRPECDGDGKHRRILMRWRGQHNGFWCRHCDLVLKIDEIELRNNRRVTAHNAMRDKLAAHYETLPPLICDYCGSTNQFPDADFVKVEHAVRTAGKKYRADVAALSASPLHANGGVLCVIEVIDSSPPSESKLKAQELTRAFYLRPQPIDGYSLHGYCSSYCWQKREQTHSSHRKKVNINAIRR